jgi:ubiquinone/menaquinone biosynthesis C-methylase UbiE
VTSDVFDQQADRYDAWYDSPAGRAAFDDEVEALRPLLHDLPRPWLEVGVGTGRIAAILSAEFGIDPAPGPLHLAAGRGVRVAVARGEALPFPDASFGAVLLVLTLCFVADPRSALREARRVLLPGGGIVLGLLHSEGPWGRHYRALAAQGHAFYRHAHFFTRAELADLLSGAGLRPVRTRSALFVAPDQEPAELEAGEGDVRAAGFTAVLVVPDMTRPTAETQDER